MKQDFEDFDAELVRRLNEMHDENPDDFFDYILGLLKIDEEVAITDRAPVEKKLKALNNLLKNLEGREKYEDCGWIVDLIKKIEDGQV
jgi:hypothetical protein